MLRITELAAPPAQPQDALWLPFELRRRSRLRARLEGGGEAALFLPRGTVLKDGDLLRAENGTVVVVRAAMEGVSCARTADGHLLARAAYHLGNRHVAVQVLPGELRYLHDPVLDDMVRALGLGVTERYLPFEPETGAYGERHVHGAEAGLPGHSHRQGEHDHGH
jgi:urease accessory protein